MKATDFIQALWDGGTTLECSARHERSEHVDYPHTPGYHYDCPACESACHCDEYVNGGNNSECIYCAIWETYEP